MTNNYYSQPSSPNPPILLLWFILVALLTAMTLLMQSFANEDKPCLKLDIVILADYSSSVYGQEGFIVDALQEFVSINGYFEEDVRIGILTFNSDTYIESHLTGDRLFLFNNLRELRKQRGNLSTDMGQALKVVKKEFEDNGRLEAKRVLIVISDGVVNTTSLETTYKIANSITNLGVTLCSVLIKGQGEEAEEFMKKISNSCYVESDYKSLVSQMKDLNLCL